jgi:nucleotide-binding universal stress UspA family protein
MLGAAARRMIASVSEMVRTRPVPAMFTDVLCAIDGTYTAARGVDRARELAARNGRITVLACSDEHGGGPWATAAMSPTRAQRRLRRAAGRVRAAGVEVETVLEPSGPPVDRVFEHAARHHLLVLGAPVVPRWVGRLIGDVAGRALHQLPSSLLIGRAAPLARGAQVLLAIGGAHQTPGLLEAAAYSAQHLDRGLLLLHAIGVEGRSAPHHIAAQHELLGKLLGREPELLVEADDPAGAIVRVAREREASLIVVGSRRLTGRWALGSISERVAYKTNCSILIVHAGTREV